MVVEVDHRVVDPVDGENHAAAHIVGFDLHE
jgi:hypothetical protein